jgi:uncharacterized membrane protein
MKTFIIIGATFISLAFFTYTIAMFFEIKHSRITKRVLLFFSIAVGLDFMATASMFTAVGKFVFNTHGLLGYSALFIMLMKLIYIYRFNGKYGNKERIPKNIRVFSFLLYVYWLIAYFTGIATAMH